MIIKQTIVIVSLIFCLVGCFLVPFNYVGAAKCGGADTSIIECDPDGDPKKIEEGAIWKVLIMAINILTGAVGVAAVGGIVYGSIMWTTAGGSLDKTKKARIIIANTVLGLIAYVLIYGFLNFIIPGGVFT